MQEFMVCPGCGDADVRRSACRRCGYSAGAGGGQGRAVNEPRRSLGQRIVAFFDWKGRLVLFVVGAVMIFYGVQEAWLRSGALEAPHEVDLANLEAGKPPPQNYIRIGKHYRVYGEALTVTVSGGHDYDYYPIVSASHPLVQGTAKPGDPGLNFAVLVKARKLPQPSEMKGLPPEDKVEGMIINDIHNLETGGDKLLKNTFPAFDGNKVIILEEGRTPTSPITSFIIIASGALLASSMVGISFLRRWFPK